MDFSRIDDIFIDPDFDNLSSLERFEAINSALDNKSRANVLPESKFMDTYFDRTDIVNADIMARIGSTHFTNFRTFGHAVYFSEHGQSEMKANAVTELTEKMEDLPDRVGNLLTINELFILRTAMFVDMAPLSFVRSDVDHFDVKEIIITTVTEVAQKMISPEYATEAIKYLEKFIDTDFYNPEVMNLDDRNFVPDDELGLPSPKGPYPLTMEEKDLTPKDRSTFRKSRKFYGGNMIDVLFGDNSLNSKAVDFINEKRSALKLAQEVVSSQQIYIEGGKIGGQDYKGLGLDGVLNLIAELGMDSKESHLMKNDALYYIGYRSKELFQAFPRLRGLLAEQMGLTIDSTIQKMRKIGIEVYEGDTYTIDDIDQLGAVKTAAERIDALPQNFVNRFARDFAEEGHITLNPDGTVKKEDLKMVRREARNDAIARHQRLKNKILSDLGRINHLKGRLGELDQDTIAFTMEESRQILEILTRK